MQALLSSAATVGVTTAVEHAARCISKTKSAGKRRDSEWHRNAAQRPGDPSLPLGTHPQVLVRLVPARVRVMVTNGDGEGER